MRSERSRRNLRYSHPFLYSAACTTVLRLWANVGREPLEHELGVRKTGYRRCLGSQRESYERSEERGSRSEEVVLEKTVEERGPLPMRGVANSSLLAPNLQIPVTHLPVGDE